MKKLEILIATMNQTDLSILEFMNVNCNAVIANQSDKNKIDIYNNNEHTVKMITTTTRGVGINRNLALKFSQGDILLFADDDIVYNDDMPKRVLQAFEELKDADVIIFGIKFSKNNEIYSTRNPKTKRLKFYNSLKYGAAVIAVRKNSLQTANISFTELFGGGCIYSHGEDSDFITQCFKNRLKLYTYNYILGICKKDSSSWFDGFNEKYFYDTGALAKNSFGILAFLFILYISFHTRNQTNIKFINKIKLMIHGYKNFNMNISFEKYISDIK